MNREWHETTQPLLYSHLSIRFSDLSSLKEAVFRIIGLDCGKKYLKHARRLDIIATPSLQDKRTAEEERVLEDTNGTFMDTYVKRWCSPHSRLKASHSGFYYEPDWSPLEVLLSRLVRVNELHYVACNMFPSCLLNAIHEFHPKCQLNIWCHQDSTRPLEYSSEYPIRTRTFFPDIEPFETALLRSPCLHSLKIQCGVSRSNSAEYGVQEEAVISALNMAPNLKHIDIGPVLRKEHFVHETNRFWNNLLSSSPKTTTVNTTCPRPISVAIDYDIFDCSSVFATLCRRMDLSLLRFLHLGVFNPAILQELSRELPSLEGIFVNLDSMPPISDARESESRTMDMFLSLKPLRFIGMKGHCSKGLLDAVLSNHGITLQSLIIEKTKHNFSFDRRTSGKYNYSMFDREDISDIARQVPHLQNLRISMERPLEKEQEFAFYNALGKFPSLKNLIIDINCAPKGYSNMAVLARTPVDETLAAIIWDRISMNRGNCTLKKLRLVPFGRDALNSADLAIYFQRMKSLLVTRTGDGDRTIQEIGREQREGECRLLWDYLHRQISTHITADITAKN